MDFSIEYIPSGIKRIFSLEDDFMNHKGNDLFYAQLLHYATYKKETNTLFLEYDEFLNRKDEFMDMCNFKSKTSFYEALEQCIERGWVIIEDVEWYGKTRKSLVFKNRFDGRYQLIEDDMIPYLIKTRSRNCVRIYIYLLNKSLWAKSRGEEYDFTFKELATVMGYNNKKRASNSFINDVKIILDSFYREGIIKYVNIYKEFGNLNILVKRITFIAQSVAELPKVTIPTYYEGMRRAMASKPMTEPEKEQLGKQMKAYIDNKKKYAF